MPIPIRGQLPPKKISEFESDIQKKQVGDNVVTTSEAKELVAGWSAKRLTPEQAAQVTKAVQGNHSTFDSGASQIIDKFLNVTLPRITIQQGLGGVPVNSAKLAWTPPTRNEDGTPLQNLKGYEVSYGTSPGNYSKTATINNPAATSFQIDNLPSGTWYFAMKAVATDGSMSKFSGEASKTVP